MNTIRTLTHKADSLNLTHLHKYTPTQTRRGHRSVLNTQPSNTDTHLSPLTSYIAPLDSTITMCSHMAPNMHLACIHLHMHTAPSLQHPHTLPWCKCPATTMFLISSPWSIRSARYLHKDSETGQSPRGGEETSR